MSAKKLSVASENELPQEYPVPVDIRPSSSEEPAAAPVAASLPHKFIDRISTRWGISVLVVLLLLIVGAILSSSSGGRKSLSWLPYNKAVSKSDIPQAGKILEVSLLYNSGGSPQFSLEKSRVLAHGYAQQNAIGHYNLNLINKTGKTIASTGFNVLVPHAPPPLPGTVGVKPEMTPSQTEFSVSIPWYADATSFTIQGLDGTTYASHSTKDITYVDNIPSFQSSGPVKKPSKSWWNHLPFVGRAAALLGNNNGVMDVTYISDGYGDLNQFHNDVSTWSSTVMSYQPYASRASQISFHYVDNTSSLGCSYNGRLLSCNDSLVVGAVNNAGAPSEIIQVLENNSTYGGSASGGDGNYGQVSVSYNGGDYGTAVGTHEMSHLVGALYDEYTGASTNGGLDGSTRYNCYAGYPPSPVWGSVDYNQGCLYPDWYRSSACSLMYAINCYYFNAISQQFLNSGIDRYTAAQDSTPPSTPVLSLGGVTTSSIGLKWTASTDNVAVGGYQVFRDGAYIYLDSDPTILNYTDYNVTSGSTHSYYVRAYDTNANFSSPSNTVTATASAIDTTLPTVSISSPINGATVSGTINITGSASDNVALSKVEVQIDSNSYQLATGTTSWSLPWNTTAVANGSHNIIAKATDTSGNIKTNTIAVNVNNAPADTTPPTVVISSPANNSTINNTSVTVSGTASDNMSVASVKLKVDNGTYVLLTGTTSWSNVLNTSQLSVGAHTVTVQATDAAGNIGLASITINMADIYLPSITITSPANNAMLSGTVNVAGTASDNVQVSKVEVQVDSNPYQLATGTTSWSYSLNTTSLSNTTHYLYARATDSSGNQNTTNSVTVTVQNLTQDTTPPSTPTNLSASAAAYNKVNLSWTASTDNVGVAGYNIIRNGTAIAQTSGTGTTYSDTTVSALTAYNYQVTAFDAKNNTSSVSNTATVTTPAAPDTSPPSAPTNLAATAASYSQINLSWTASTDNVGVAGYYIVRNGTTIAQITGTSTNYSDTTVNPSTAYSYQVMAYDAAGNTSSLSNSATVTTPAAPDTSPPSAPSNLTATAASYSQVNLTWSASTDNVGVTAYDIYRSSVKIASVSASSTSYGDTNLTASTVYNYYVIARDAAGNQSTASNTATATTPSQPPIQTAGVIYGTTYSNKGGTLSSTTITLSFGGNRHSYSSDIYGNYFIGSVPAGTYNVKYSHQGFYSSNFNVTVISGQNTNQNVTLTSRK